jgi:hypothetical protein
MLEFTLDVSSLASLSGAWIRSYKMIYCDLLADFTTLKGAKSNPICYLTAIENRRFSDLY